MVPNPFFGKKNDVVVVIFKWLRLRLTSKIVSIGYLIHFDQLSMLIKSAENPSHFYHLSSFNNQACSACLTQIAR